MTNTDLINLLVMRMGQLSMTELNSILLAMEAKLDDEESDREEDLSEDEAENWYGLTGAISDAVLYTNELAERWD